MNSSSDHVNVEIVNICHDFLPFLQFLSDTNRLLGVGVTLRSHASAVIFWVFLKNLKDKLSISNYQFF